MPCYSPLEGFRAQSLTKNGKRKIVFNEKQGFRDLPVTVPCGQCIGCRLERARQWAMRLMHEKQFHEEACFVTLTYDDAHLPSGGTLVKSDFQKFFKRLRKGSGRSLRYFHCGEYGEADRRPHYHAIIFGIGFLEDRRFHTRNGQGQVVYKSATLDKYWAKGFCTLGEVTFDSCGYVARYVLKKVTGDAAARHYEGFDLETGEVVSLLPEYVTMSLKPAIGAKWYDKWSSDVFPRDECVVRGKSVPPPRYYWRKLEKENPDQHKTLKYRRIRSAAKYKADQTPERRAVKLAVKLSQLKTLSRKL